MSIDNSLNEAIQAFTEESRELLTLSEITLIKLEEVPEDPDLIGELFRSIHTIKGASGIFGFDSIVDFTHIVESVMGRVRDGELKLDESLISTFLESNDHIAVLVECALSEIDINEEDKIKGKLLSEKLNLYLKDNIAEIKEPHYDEGDINSDMLGDHLEHEHRVLNDFWHLSLRFNKNILQSGMDPLSFFHYLSTVGEIVHMTTIEDELPDIQDFCAEDCYLGFEIDLKTTATKDEIADVFEFVKDDCILHILSPHSLVFEYARFVDELPDENYRIGEILVKTGALTQRELLEALDIQKAIEQEYHANDEKKSKLVPALGEIMVKKGMVSPPLINVALEKQQKVRSSQLNKQQNIRINSQRLGRLIDLVGELVIASAHVSSQAVEIENDALAISSENLSRLVDEVREVSLGLRMVQIGETFSRYKRVVRDLSKDLGKLIDLQIEGGETELDKTVVEKISDPLMHMVRNAIDHGIESPEERLEKGKSKRAQLSLRAFHESGSVVIEICDDGRGLDREKILEKAMQKGLLQNNTTLSDSDVFRLIFEPGFSTAQQVSNVSGRGVGMDVVRRNIDDLRGQVEVDSKPGVGSKFTIRLPLTLAIIDGFHVNVGNTSFIIPLGMVDECIELDNKLPIENRGGNYLNLRGDVLPYVYLGEMFGDSRDKKNGNKKYRDNIVVVQCGGIKTGLVVDELLGEQQAVIKPLGKVFQNLKYISGATILGGGDVGMIIDVPQLVVAIH